MKDEASVVRENAVRSNEEHRNDDHDDKEWSLYLYNFVWRRQ